ncbi:DBF4-type zinc finger-containing protein 2 isoform X1 [Perognathus longimembris pacificus]|uniref:DBF4-type zinc finger-containing protein 2 isoform X1 n=1 Tax=Perognathus longimembris pacificus TaxID=214514 RepID=UPI002019518D|nr:DBF4-type zinc finger-containing protein 2 isoform X1 [Perognathus longimembris pacificus]XP_048200844.1 DBF4-type zinc finger-containing protein 2 isoform X1 [Perognathus longimembris pacificus]
MQKSQGYCSYCRVQYSNLEQHLFSAQHRSSTRQSRSRICSSGLMERFLQDVLRHHPYNYQDTRSAQNETPPNPGSPDVVVVDEFRPEERDEETESEEMYSDESEPAEDLQCRPSQSQECASGFSSRPSVIQKLEMGQQQSLAFGHKIESGNDLPEVAVGVIIQKEEYVHLARKNDTPIDCEINLDSHAPLRSVTNPPELYVKKLNSHKEEQVHVNKKNEPAESALNSNYDFLNLMPGCSEDPITDVNFQKNKHIYLGTENNEFVSETSLGSDTLYPSVICKPQVLVENTWLQKEKHAELPHTSAEFYHSEINLDSDVPQYPLTESQGAGKKAKKKTKHTVEKNDTLGASELTLNSNVLPQLVTVKPQLAVLKEDHVDPEDESAKLRGFETNLNIDTGLLSVLDQTQQTFSKEEHDEEHSKDSKYHKMAQEVKLWKENISLENKTEEPRGSKIMHDSDVSFQSIVSQPDITVKQINLEHKDQMYLENENRQYSLAADFPIQSVIEEPEFIELQSEDSQSFGSEASFESDDSLQSLAVQLSDDSRDSDFSMDEDMDLEGKRDETEGFRIIYDSNVLRSVASQTDVVQETNCRKERVDLEDKVVQPNDANINFDPNEILQSVTDKIEETIKEANLLRETHIRLGGQSFDPGTSGAINLSRIPFWSVIRPPQSLREEHSSLEGGSHDPEIPSDSSNPCHSVTSQAEVVLDNSHCEEQVELEDKTVQPSGSKINSDSDELCHSVTNKIQEPTKEVNLLKKGPAAHLDDKGYEPHGSGAIYASKILYCSVIQPLQILQKEHSSLEVKSSDPCDPEACTDSSDPCHSMAGQAEILQDTSHWKEHGDLEDETVQLSDGSEANLDSDEPLQSVTNTIQAPIQERNLKERSLCLDEKGYEQPGSGITYVSNIPFCSVIRPPQTLQEDQSSLEVGSRDPYGPEESLDSSDPCHSVAGQTEVVQDNSHWRGLVDLKDKMIEPGGSKLNTDPDNLLQPVTNEIEEPVEERNHLNERLDNNSSEPGSSGIIHFSNTPSCFVIQPPQILQEENSSLEVQSSDPGGPEISFDSSAPFHSVIGQTEVVPEASHWKDKVIEPGHSKINSDSDKPLQSVTNKVQELFKEVDHLKEGYASLDDQVCEPGGSGIIRVSHNPFCSVIQPPQILQEQHSSLEVGSSDPCDPEESFDSSDPCYSVAEQIEVTETSQEAKTVQSCDSEINSDSDELLQSVTTESQVPIEDVNLPSKEPIHLDDKDCEPCASGAIYASDTSLHAIIPPPQILPEDHSSLEVGSSDSYGPEISSDSSDPCHSVAEETEVFQETSHWEEHVDLEDKTVQPSDSKMNTDSDELLSVTNEIQEPTNEANLLSDTTDYEPDDSVVFHVSNNPLHSVIEPPEILQVEHSSLEDKTSDPCCPIISFDSSDPCHSGVGQLHNTVEEINLKEDHVYLEDKSYRLVDVEASCDSDIPVQIVVDQSVEDESVKEITLETKDNNDIENEDYQPGCSEIRYDSDLHQQSEIDPPQVVCQETGLPKKELLGMEEKSSESSDSEMIYDADVSFEIVVNQGQTSDSETESPQVVIVNVAANDSDCDREVISDSNIPLEVVNEPPQVTVQDTSSTDSPPVVGSLKCDFCGFEVKYDPSTFLQSVTNPSKKSFRIINRNNDYIILGDSTCQSCGYELNFNVAPSKPVTFQPQGPGQSGGDSGDKSRESNDSKRDFNLEGTSQAVNNQLQKTDTEDNRWGDVINTGMDNSNPAADEAVSSAPVIEPISPQANPSTSEHSDLERMSGSEKDSQGDLSLQSNPGKHQVPIKKRRRKRATSDPREDSQSSYVPKVKNRKKAALDRRENTHDAQSSSASVDHQSSYIPQVDSGKSRKKGAQSLRENSCGSQSSSAPIARQPGYVPRFHSGKRRKKVSFDLRENTHYFYPGSALPNCPPNYVLQNTGDSRKNRKKVTFDLRENTRYFHPGSAPIACQSSCVPRVDSGKKKKKKAHGPRENTNDSPSCSASRAHSVRGPGRNVVEENPNEPVLEALPHVPPSFVGKTWTQIMKEDDVKINTLVKEFKEGRFRCYFDDNSDNNEVFFNEEENNTWPEFNQDTESVQAQSDPEVTEGSIVENSGIAETLAQPQPHCSRAEEPPKPSENVASQSQVEKVSNGTEINYKNYPLKKRKINRPVEEPPKKINVQSDSAEEKKPKSRAFVFPTLEFKVVEPNSLICVSSVSTKRMEEESFSSPNTKQYSYEQNNPSNPLLKKTATNSPQNPAVPHSGRPKKANTGLTRRNWSTRPRKNARKLAPAAPARYELRSRYRATKSATAVGNSEDASASGVLNDNCQPAPLSPDVAKMASKPVRNEFFDVKSKKKTPKGKITTDEKSHYFKNASEAVILRQKFRLASAKLSVRVQMKANYVIRKYLLRYSVFLRRRFQRRGTVLGTYLKKKMSLANRVKEVKRAAEMFLSSSLLPIAVGKRLRAISSLSPKKSMRHPSSVRGRRKYRRRYHRKKSAPIREYDLRSSSSVPNVVRRMVTRLTSKLRSNEVPSELGNQQ